MTQAFWTATEKRNAKIQHIYDNGEYLLAWEENPELCQGVTTAYWGQSQTKARLCVRRPSEVCCGDPVFLLRRCDMNCAYQHMGITHIDQSPYDILSAAKKVTKFGTNLNCDGSLAVVPKSDSSGDEETACIFCHHLLCVLKL